MSRKLARESVYKLVFEFLFLNEVNQRTFNILSSIELADSDREYMQRAYFRVIQRKKEIMQIIEELSEGLRLKESLSPTLPLLCLRFMK